MAPSIRSSDQRCSLWWRPLTSTPSPRQDLDAELASTLAAVVSIDNVGDSRCNKPLPALPPARTPSQISHQRQHQLPYRASRHPRRHDRCLSAPSAPIASSSQLTAPPMQRTEALRLHFYVRARQDESLPRETLLPATWRSAARPLGHPSSVPTARPMPSFASVPALADSSSLPPAYDTLFDRSRLTPLPSSSSSCCLNAIPEDQDNSLILQQRRPNLGTRAGSASPEARNGRKGTANSPQYTPRTPVTNRSRLSSSPSPSPAAHKRGFAILPANPPALGQCWGIKRDGNRCTRSVKPFSLAPRKEQLSLRTNAIAIADSDSEEGDIHHGQAHCNRGTRVATYCHQHACKINKSLGLHLPRSGRYVPFEAYLCDASLKPLTAARLRVAMSDALTSADLSEHGYLYIYELLDRSDDEYLCLKVGRSTNPMYRISQWRSQCQSRKPIFRALYPSATPTASNGGASVVAVQQGLVVGAHAATHQGLRGSHRWEKLVHIELADLCSRIPKATRRPTGLSGSEGWEDHEEGEDDDDDMSQAVRASSNAVCDDCQRRHREIFLVPRRAAMSETTSGVGAAAGACRSQRGASGSSVLLAEGDRTYRLVVDICLKWQRFVELLAQDV